jgi:dihydrodipicolinate synthase/N-acetylneuraminate lyase
MAIPNKGPIVVAPTPTPFDTEDRVDHGMFVRNIERLRAKGSNRLHADSIG